MRLRRTTRALTSYSAAASSSPRAIEGAKSRVKRREKWKISRGRVERMGSRSFQLNRTLKRTRDFPRQSGDAFGRVADTQLHLSRLPEPQEMAGFAGAYSARCTRAKRVPAKANRNTPWSSRSKAAAKTCGSLLLFSERVSTFALRPCQMVRTQHYMVCNVRRPRFARRSRSDFRDFRSSVFDATRLTYLIRASF